MPLPGWCRNGFGMKVACAFSEIATSLITCRKVMMLSAIDSASA